LSALLCIRRCGHSDRQAFVQSGIATMYQVLDLEHVIPCEEEVDANY
jgi:hypothetical protein